MNTERYLPRHASLCAVIVLLCAALASCSLSPAPGSTTNTVNLRDGLGPSENEGWIVLSRPSSIWTVSTIIERLPARSGSERPRHGENLDCFPEEAWLVVPGTAPKIQYGRTIDYGLSVSATLG